MGMHQKVRVGMPTPWGRADQAVEMCEGIGAVATPSHGGILLSDERQAAMPSYLRHEDGWYEEDCEWCKPFVVFSDDLIAAAEERWDKATIRACSTVEGAGDHGTARETLRAWYPDLYEEHFGVKLKPGQSHTRDRQVFYTEHAADLVVVSAIGSGDKCPDGMVLVSATVGGVRLGLSGARRFLVPSSEYSGRECRIGFVVDPARHEEVAA